MAYLSSQESMANEKASRRASCESLFTSFGTIDLSELMRS